MFGNQKLFTDREVENMTHNEEIDQSFKTNTDVKICKQGH